MSTQELDQFAGRPFSFYPPILNIEHNEWTCQKGSWSEVLVRNTKTEMDLWMPRRFLGEVSQVDEPVMIVGLNQELEYKGGTVWPHKRRVIRMPRMTRPSPPSSARAKAPPPKARQSATEKKIGRLIVGALVVGILATFVLVGLYRGRQSGGRINYKAILQVELELTGGDNYYNVVRKLGTPAEERWRSDVGERQYRALSYPDLSLTAILMGADRDDVFYIGAKDNDWRNVHSVELPGGGNTDSILRSLERF